MLIQLVNGYLTAMDNGRVLRITCENDPDHLRPFARYTENDRLELYCLACEWTKPVTYYMYDEMRQCLALDDLRWLEVE